MISYDPLAAFNSGIYSLIPNNNPAYVSNNWDVAEKVYLGYVKADLSRKIGSVPMTGNIGAQIISSEQTATGLSANGHHRAGRGEHSYVDFVPSLNLNFKVADGKMVRFERLLVELARNA